MSHAQAIRTNYKVLLRCTTVNFYVIDSLRAEDIIDEEQESVLRTEKNPRKQRTILFHWLEEISSDRYESFLKVMKDTEQEHVADLLRGSTYESKLPLSDARYERLEKIRPKLAKAIQIDTEVLAELRILEAISETDVDEIRAEKVEYVKSSKMINAIMRRSNHSYDCSQKVLRKTLQNAAAEFLSEGEMPAVHLNNNRPDLDGPLSLAFNDVIRNGTTSDAEIMNLLSDLNELDLNPARAIPGQSIIIFIYCKTIDNAIKFTQLFNSGRLQDILGVIFNRLHLTIEPHSSKELDSHISLDDDDIISLEEFTGIEGCVRESQYRPYYLDQPCGRDATAQTDEQAITKSLTDPRRRMTDSEIFIKPLCLLDFGPDGKMTVNTLVLDQLKSLDKEVVVVCIAGPYRTGKSYLMNKLAGQNKGFALGSTVQSKTKGIWIWVRNHPIHADKYLVLLDTEGLGDVEKDDENHDYQIFCLSVLLASTLVYNVMGVIGNDDIIKLHFIAELSRHIKAQSSTWVGSKSDDANFDVYFPDFVYAIRDFGLDLEIDGREISADEYLERSLTMKESTRYEVKTFNKIRSCIRRYFKKRKCFTFVRPFAGKCRDLDDVTDDKLLPEFRKETQDFLDFIFNESPVKEVGGKRLSGRMFGSLVEVYVEQMKTGVPYVENAVETMARMENSKAKDEASSLYYNLMLESLTMPVDDDAEFSRCHNNCLQKAIDLFLAKAVFDDDQTFQTQMNEDIEKTYKELVQTNEDICRDKCQAVLKELYEPINENLKAGKYTRSGGFQLYKNDVRDFEDTYKRQIGRIGVKMPHVLLEFLHSKQTEEDAILKADEMVTEADKQQEAERQKANEAHRLKEEAERAADQQARHLKEQQRAYTENVSRLETQMKEENEAARKHHEEVLYHRSMEQQRLIEEGFKRDADQMRTRVDELQRQNQENQNRGRRRSSDACIIQ